jgi:hypothetical protein
MECLSAITGIRSVSSPRRKSKIASSDNDDDNSDAGGIGNDADNNKPE